ncbi:Kae1-associated serine/threonine protein kinase, partial [Candidatus Pacearchaeota archaeon]|nr:Kae1-associated serine/threonine protein kinase [Candidatus Pacearchaeota archaeon]
MSNQKILQRGAEALIILKDNKLIIKRRVAKSYRLSELDDRLRRQRTRSEVKLLEKASKIISVPQIENVDENKKEISMDFIKGKKLSKHLNKFPLNKQKDICLAIGQNIAKLHNVDIIHGDLTTSNMIYIEEKTKDNKKILGDKKLSKISNYPNSS